MLRQLLCFPSELPQTGAPSTRLTRFRVLVETAAGHVLFMEIPHKQVPARALIERIAELLARYASDCAAWPLVEGQVEDQLHVTAKLLDEPFLEIASWNIERAVGQLLPTLATAHAGQSLGALRERVFDEARGRMSRALESFGSQLDDEALRLLSWGEPRMSRYNYLVHSDPLLKRNRRQAFQALPFLACRDLWEDELVGVLEKAREAIDAGRSYWDVLRAGFRVTRSSIRFLAQCPLPRLATQWNGRLGRLARVLEGMAPEFRPHGIAQWKAMHDAVNVIEASTRYSVGAPFNRLWLAQAARRGFIVTIPSGQHAAALCNGMNEMRDVIKDVVMCRVIDAHDALLSNQEMAIRIHAVTQRFLTQMSFDSVLDLVRRWQDATRRHQDMIWAGHDRLGDSTWLAPIAEFATEDRLVLPILTQQELKDEGLWMRNCVASYVASCSVGNAQIWSIRDPYRQRLTTLETRFERGTSGRMEAYMVQHQGLANRKPDAASDRAARILVAELNRRSEEFVGFWRWRSAMHALKAGKRSREYVSQWLEPPLEATLPVFMSLDAIESAVRRKVASEA